MSQELSPKARGYHKGLLLKILKIVLNCPKTIKGSLVGFRELGNLKKEKKKLI